MASGSRNDITASPSKRIRFIQEKTVMHSGKAKLAMVREKTMHEKIEFLETPDINGSNVFIRFGIGVLRLQVLGEFLPFHQIQ
jgi:hypothetical protein